MSSPGSGDKRKYSESLPSSGKKSTKKWFEARQQQSDVKFLAEANEDTCSMIEEHGKGWCAKNVRVSEYSWLLCR